MTPLSQDKIDDLAAKEKARLDALPHFGMDPAHVDCGVLLSDRIEHYCGRKFQLISPFEKKYLRPAGYSLRVGDNYAINGETRDLRSGGPFVIEPYQVAIIQTVETLNLPNFLIGRWNIKVALAYEGLLWVGGAQVDPGFRGLLSCPIYNLSTKSLELRHGDELAAIDFVTTTPFGASSLAFHGKRSFFSSTRRN